VKVETDVHKKFQKELNSGTAALILLGVLDRAGEPLYGYQIAKMIEAEVEDMPMMKQGALYPVLRSLHGSGFLDSRVDPSVSGPPRRYYTITKEGKKILSDWKDIWDRTKMYVDNFLKGNNHD
jgi:PadR family transcriptional regulator PadR